MCTVCWVGSGAGTSSNGELRADEGGGNNGASPPPPSLYPCQIDVYFYEIFKRTTRYGASLFFCLLLLVGEWIKRIWNVFVTSRAVIVGVLPGMLTTRAILMLSQRASRASVCRSASPYLFVCVFLCVFVCCDVAMSTSVRVSVRILWFL